MHFILPHTRASLTAIDCRFICETLQDKDPEDIFHWLSDPDLRDEILDTQSLFHSILESPYNIFISLDLYFYILTRNILRRYGMEDREVADYIAAVLAAFAYQQIITQSTPAKGAFIYMIDLWQDLEKAHKNEQFYLIVSAANILMIMTGIFPDYIEQRCKRCASPGLDYYEAFGQRYYESARSHPLAKQYQLDPIFSQVTDSFTTIRTALNDIRERLLILEQTPDLRFDL